MSGVMRAALASAHGAPGKVLSISSSHPRPVPAANEMLVRVLACSLAAGDKLMLKGSVKAFVKPAAWPFVPGADICGLVECAPPDVSFQRGDRVIASLSRGMTSPVGGLAEYAAVRTQDAARAPAAATAAQAAALPVSPVTALQALDAAALRPSESERVLVLGGSGGVGTALIQLVKHTQPSAYVAATSTAADLVASLGADRVIDYRETRWWEVPEFRERPFDVVFDCVGEAGTWQVACSQGAVKSSRRGGRFVCVAFAEEPRMQSAWQAAATLAPVLARPLWTRAWRWSPRYVLVMASSTPDALRRVAVLVEEGALRVVLTSESPLPFTREGVVHAFEVLCSNRAKGKLVVSLE